MIYTPSGLPIYSKCYGTFCKAAFKNPELLSGLLSAIETIPMTLSDNLSLQSVKMGDTEMRFAKSTPGGHSIVVGLSEDKPEIADELFNAVSKTLASDRFKDVDWDFITSEVMTDFEDELLNQNMNDALHEYGGFKDECPLGDMCPIHTTAVKSRTQQIWGAIKDKYAAMKKKMSGGG
jgi:hypothetical protein